MALNNKYTTEQRKIRREIMNLEDKQRYHWKIWQTLDINKNKLEKNLKNQMEELNGQIKTHV